MMKRFLLAGAWALAAGTAAAADPAAGRYVFSVDDGDGQPPYTMTLYVQTLPGEFYQVHGSLLLDDAELGVVGSGRVRQGKWLLDLVASGGVRDEEPDAGKRALFAPGQVPPRVSAAGFATMHVELDATDLAGVMQRYQTNVVSGHHVQGPVYADSQVRPLK